MSESVWEGTPRGERACRATAKSIVGDKHGDVEPMAWDCAPYLAGEGNENKSLTGGGKNASLPKFISISSSPP